MQPAGYVHSQGFLDPARLLRHQLRRLGAQVSLGKNRLREDAVNIVFGAHLGFPEDLLVRHSCVFFNLEQLGNGGAEVRLAYLNLLRNNPVVDYDLANVGSYSNVPKAVPVVSMAYAPYLDTASGTPLEERPIDLLFFGSINVRRKSLIEKIEACGVTVSVFDHPIYGPERDEFIRQAKAVLNCHFYESSRFEQVRAAHCLSLGTPLVSERQPRTRPASEFEGVVSWFDDTSLESFFTDHFSKTAYFDAARKQLDSFRRNDPIDAYAELLAFSIGVHKRHITRRNPSPDHPTHLMLTAGRGYEPGWFNVDAAADSEPDLILDLGQPLQLPIEATGRSGGRVRLDAGQLSMMRAKDLLPRISDVGTLMSNALLLLNTGGEIEVEVPYEKALTAWQDPRHRRAMNENSWSCFTEAFWQLGWFEHRFDMVSSSWLDLQRSQCCKEQAAFMRVRLRKIQTTPHERTVARANRADFGGIDEDVLPLADDGVSPTTGSRKHLRAA